MARQDISDYVVHFTKSDGDASDYDRIRKILSERRLIGTDRLIRGAHTCICFSEAPLAALENGLLNSSSYSRYSPYGVIFHKSWMFQQGGRPVIYQPYDDYDDLPPSAQWRHVTYDPTSTPPIDFTWEREWRLPKEELYFDNASAAMIVPDQAAAKSIIADHHLEEEARMHAYSQIFSEEEVQMYYEDFLWNFYTLK